MASGARRNGRSELVGAGVGVRLSASVRSSIAPAATNCELNAARRRPIVESWFAHGTINLCGAAIWLEPHPLFAATLTSTSVPLPAGALTLTLVTVPALRKGPPGAG